VAISEVVSDLDSYQQAAVDHGDGPAIVLAGPGAGKTRVIVERAARLLTDPADPRILVLTFSRKAASELAERIAARIRRSYSTFPVTTFHGFAYRLIGDDARLARAAERERAMREALAAHNNIGLSPTRGLVQEALDFSSLCDEYLTEPAHDLTPVRATYLESLTAAGLIDYGGLQRRAVELLQDEDARRAVAAQYRHVLVDEYQDTNVAQERLLELIARDHRNVFCVADEDQSIYGFRGAEIENALRFEQRWAGAATYPLPLDYRSAPGIVEAAKSVIRLNVDTHRDKELEPVEDRPATLTGRTFRHVAEEADWIAREVARLRLHGTPLGEVAILARSLRGLGPRLAYALRSHGIPFYAPLATPLHPTADALVSLVELALPERWTEAQDEQALGVLASPLFGADALELRRFRRAERSVYGALRDDGSFDGFFRALGIIRRQKRVGDAVYALWDRLEYFRGLQERTGRGSDPTPEDVEELEAVTQLSDTANEFEGQLADFPPAYRSGELADEDWLPARSTLPADAIAVLTVHQAKGLEWDAVFICDLVEGRFPALARSQHSLFDRDAFGEAALDEATRARRALEEERRLFYVAFTRARTGVTLTATEEGAKETGRALSRFYLEAERFLHPPTDEETLVSAEEARIALRRVGGGDPGWRDLDESSNGSVMLPTGGLRTSASNIAPYENCPLQFYFGSLLELVRPSGPNLVLGSALHDVLEAFHNPESPEPQTRERLLELASEKWRAGRIEPAALESEFRRRLQRMLERYWEFAVRPGLGGDVLAVERRFLFPLDTSQVAGRIDRVDRLEDGRLRLVDYKSSKHAMSAAKAEEDLQLALYALAFLEDPELLALGEVVRLEFVYPGDDPAYGRVKTRGRDVDSELSGKTRERMRGLIAEIVAEHFDFSPEADCKFCDFKSICPRHHGDVPV
jgi:superfamily I DNA/RNA helicase/RecB family exonuclease